MENLSKLSVIYLVDICNSLLSRDLKRNLFNLFASWSGQYAKPLCISSASLVNEDEKLQFCALQVSFMHNSSPEKTH